MLTATNVVWAPAPEGLGGHGSCLTQEVAIRTVKQSSVMRETENGEEGEEEGAEFGEEDLFHQQVGPRGLIRAHTCTHVHPRPCWLDPSAVLTWAAAALSTTGLGWSLAPHRLPQPLALLGPAVCSWRRSWGQHSLPLGLACCVDLGVLVQGPWEWGVKADCLSRCHPWDCPHGLRECSGTMIWSENGDLNNGLWGEDGEPSTTPC